MIEVFKIFRRSDNISAENYCTVDITNITKRRDILKVIAKGFSPNEAKYFTGHLVNWFGRRSFVILYHKYH